MSALITTFAVTRESKPNKDGISKVSTRDLLGIISSGNRKERDAAVCSLVTAFYCEGNFKPLTGQISRAFGKDFTDGAKFLGLDAATGLVCTTSAINTRAAWERLFQGLQDKHDAKPYKGERAVFVSAIKQARDTFAFQAAERQAAASAAQALKDAGLDTPPAGTVDVVATEAAPLMIENADQLQDA